MDDIQTGYFDFGQPMPADAIIDDTTEEEGDEPDNFFTYIPNDRNIAELAGAVKRFYNLLPTGMDNGRITLCAILLRAMLTEEATE